jgi:hypothetical protein
MKKELCQWDDQNENKNRRVEAVLELMFQLE